MKILTVIPSEVEESRGVPFGYCFGIPRLRFASLGMTTVVNASTLQHCSAVMTGGARHSVRAADVVQKTASLIFQQRFNDFKERP